MTAQDIIDWLAQFPPETEITSEVDHCVVLIAESENAELVFTS